jgi:GNAT superfamily N-acetyltransferase
VTDRTSEAGVAGNMVQPCVEALAPGKKRWTTEFGTLWALETAEQLPAPVPARVPVTFAEARQADLAELSAAMGLATTEKLQKRLQGLGQNRRRCFLIRESGGTIAAYGWVTHGVECVGELERTFHLRRDEAYLWDFVTLPAWRGQRLYSALLSYIIYQLHREGVPLTWIGAGRPNRPSVRGIAKAGFRHVVDCNYYRLYRLSLLWMKKPLAAADPLVAEAYRILAGEHERRVGRVLVGVHR